MRRALPLLLLFTATASASAQDAPKLTNYAWLAGTWTAIMPNGEVLEEIWSKPGEKDMMGVFRWGTAGGTPKFYEILTASVEDGKLVLRVRHFHGNLKAWEEKDKPLEFVATDITKEKVVFAQSGERPAKLTYEKTGDDTFTATLQVPARPALVMKFKRTK